MEKLIIYKGIDTPRTFWGLKGKYIIYFMIIFSSHLFGYMLISSFFQPITVLVIISLSFTIATSILITISKKLGVDGIEKKLSVWLYPKRITRSSPKILKKRP